MHGYLDKFLTWISLHLSKEALNALRKIQFIIGTNFWNTLEDLLRPSNTHFWLSKLLSFINQKCTCEGLCKNLIQVTLICISSRKVEAIQESFSDLKAILITDLDDLRFLGLLIRLNFSLCEKLSRRSLDLKLANWVSIRSPRWEKQVAHHFLLRPWQLSSVLSSLCSNEGSLLATFWFYDLMHVEKEI